jgi:2-iminobutanoate/2-iminopropanoate deaminase
MEKLNIRRAPAHLFWWQRHAAIMSKRSETMQRIRSDRTVRANLPFSDAVWHGNTLYLSGHLGLDPKTGKPGATPEDEARLVLDAVKGTLEAAGLTMSDLLSVQIFCSDVSLFDQFNTVYRTYFPGGLPARAFLGSGRLLFDARFEVQGIAGR